MRTVLSEGVRARQHKRARCSEVPSNAALWRFTLFRVD